MQIPIPQTTKEVRRFLGITSWYRRFVPNFAKIAQPLTQLLKKGKHWKWGPEQQEAFEALKDYLTKAPVLACPDFTKPFTLQTDASDTGLGAVLTQDIDNAEHVIAYASRHLNGAEKNYSTTEKECLAIVWGIRKMRHYLEGYEFRVLTDHLSLKWLNSIDNPTGRLARWALELQQYKFSIIYQKGKQNVVADALSRQPKVEINLAQSRPVASCSWYNNKMEEVKKNPNQHSDFTIVNNQLYRHFTREINDEDSTPWKLCVPPHLRQKVLEETHDKVTGGHLGMRKTLNKAANRYYWPGMARDVSRYVRQCETCQRYKISQQQPAGKMLTRIPNEPWSLVCADFIGPLPRTRHGNTMLLVLFDNFSKWVELSPMRKATAEGVVKALRERIVSRYGVPKGLITDNGTQFTSRVLRKYLDAIGVHQQFTAPYTPQENPTERVNRTIKTIIAQFSGEEHNRWDELLPEIMLAVNTSESESTGYSPAYLTQGRIPRLPKSLYDEVTIGSGARCLSPDERATELKEIFKIVRRNQEAATQKQKHHYNLRRRSWKPGIGDQVLVRQHPLSKAINNFTAKLAPKFGGPYIVTGFISPVIVRLRTGENDAPRTAHLSDLKPYHTDNQLFSLSIPRWPKNNINTVGEKMETEEQKFERSRQKFRLNMQREKEKGRRTIFLNNNEGPGPTKRNYHNTRSPTASPYPHKSTSSKENTAQHRRVTTLRNQGQVDPDVVFPPSGVVQPPSYTNHGSGDDDIMPPTPTLRAEADGDKQSEPPPPPKWDDKSVIAEDLHIQPEDLEDPLIQDFVRTFCGATTKMIDRRAPTPPSPSPPSSPSSIDWENDNFRPPTPPRRRMFGTLDIEDRKYPYLGMQCYERVWRARILVPTRKTPAALVGGTPTKTETPPGSPSRQKTRAEHSLPITPGRGWLSHPAYGSERPNSPPDNICTVSQQQPPTPPKDDPTHPEVPVIASTNPVLAELPLQLQQEIQTRKEKHKGTRTRFTYNIDGQQHRITITRSGDVRVSQL